MIKSLSLRELNYLVVIVELNIFFSWLTVNSINI